MELKDIFDRQKRIEDWDQTKIKDSCALVLGGGGLGTIVIMHLLRLGVGKVIFVDYDVVDLTNLPRQMLFGKNDVGKYKVDTILKNAEFHNIDQTKLEGYNFDALKNWSKIVGFAKQSNGVFNLIDHGDYFDAAVQSLCIKLNLPLICGGNYSNTISIDFFHPEGRPCFLCLTENLKQEILEKILPDKILELDDISFLQPNDNPQAQSNPMLCTVNGVFLVNMFKNYIFMKSFNMKSIRVLFYLNDFETMQWDLEKNPKCIFCKKLEIAHSGEHTVSTVINLPIDLIWQPLFKLQLEKLFPKYIKSTNFVQGQPGQVCSVLEINYMNEATWTVRIVEISVQDYFISYEIIQTEPKTEFSAQNNKIQLQRITDTNTTFVQWDTQFSNDASIETFLDSQLKKEEYIKSLNQQF